MASAGKRQRDHDKQLKAAQKRDRRQGRQARSPDDAVENGPSGASDSEAANREILDQIEDLHRQFEAHAISFDSYEERRTELLGRIKI